MITFFFKFMLYILLCCTPVVTLAKDSNLLREVNNYDGSRWYVEKNDEKYILKYINARGVVYSNSAIITSDVEGSGLFLNNNSNGDVSLIMDYPRDLYEFRFSSGDKASLLSACKQIKLPSTSTKQAVAILTLCSKSVSAQVFSKLEAETVLASKNLVINGRVKTIIGNDKAFLYDGNGLRVNKNPYLIKGDDIEVLEYKNSFLKVRYMSINKSVVSWIQFSDIL